MHRSSKNISVQLIDDANGRDRSPPPRRSKRIWACSGKNNVEAAAKVGAAIAERARRRPGSRKCYFDRGGFLFHGKVKALAEAAREGGLKF